MTEEIPRVLKLIQCFVEKYGYTPVFGDPRLKDVFNDDELVDYFEYAIKIWIEKPLKALCTLQDTTNDPDYGFAMMMIINSIPEFLGKIQGHPKNKLYEKGIEYILGEDIDSDMKECLRLKLRGSIAHNLFTQEGIILNAGSSTHAQYDSNEATITINPVALSKTFLNAIHRYIEALRAELDSEQDADTNLFSSFKEYMTDKKIYFAVKYQRLSYGYLRRAESAESYEVEYKIKNMEGFQVFCGKPRIVVETSEQLLRLCKQLVHLSQ